MRWAPFALGAAAAAVAALLVLLALGGRLLVDALWFGQLGYGVVFRTMLGAKVVCFAVALAAAWPLIAGIGLSAVQDRRSGQVRIVLRRSGDGAATIPELIAPIADRIPWKTLVIAVSGILGVLFALGQASAWDVWLRWIYGREFGETDPIFGADVSFYLFTLPAWRALVGGALALVILGGMVATVVFWLQGALDFRRPGAALPERAIRLGSLLLGAALVVKAADYWVGRYELLLEPGGAVFGAGYTAANIRLPLQWVLAVLALGGAAVSFVNLRQGRWQLPVGAVVVVVGASIVATILPDLYQRLRVRPDELRLERPYLEHNIRMTRLAYGLERITPRPFAAASSLDVSALERNQPTFSNVRLWDPKPLLDTYRQLQVIRLYYDFHDIDIDRYDLPSGRRQVMLGAREIVAEQLPPNARTWVNQRLQFTHGFGVVMSPVTEVEDEGLPMLFVKDIPPKSSVGLEVREPRIYYGERTTEYVIVKTSAQEFDYPKGDENVTTRYAGDGGVPFGTFPRRALFAWVFGDVNLLISQTIGPESRILFRRSIRERISTLAPFLRLDQDPYVVISDGRLYWIQDAYTISDSFPYSEPVAGLPLNYIRNSVKVVVDAYHGTVSFYATEPSEPVLATYAAIFPGMFRPIDEMPEDLRRHVRYPENLFYVQAEMYRTYHMTNPDVFYNKEDLWTFPTETVDGTRTTVQPYYVIMRLPGEDQEEFLLMQPMTPSNRDNMVAWLAARCDAPGYGELVEYQFPKDKLVYGPQQIEARIDQDTVISQQLSLWDQMGSRVIRGNLLVIPVEDSVVYVEPLFLRSEQGQIPELKRVIAAYGDRVSMEPTLEAALRNVLGDRRARGASPPTGAPAAPVVRELHEEIRGARSHYEAALESLRRGDWTSFGREMDNLGRALETPPETPPAASPE